MDRFQLLTINGILKEQEMSEDGPSDSVYPFTLMNEFVSTFKFKMTKVKSTDSGEVIVGQCLIEATGEKMEMINCQMKRMGGYANFLSNCLRLQSASIDRIQSYRTNLADRRGEGLGLTDQNKYGSFQLGQLALCTEMLAHLLVSPVQIECGPEVESMWNSHLDRPPIDEQISKIRQTFLTDLYGWGDEFNKKLTQWTHPDDVPCDWLVEQEDLLEGYIHRFSSHLYLKNLQGYDYPFYKTRLEAVLSDEINDIAWALELMDTKSDGQFEIPLSKLTDFQAKQVFLERVQLQRPV